MNEKLVIEELKADNQRLRTLLAVTFSGYKLYTEEGQLQDSSALPFIDFKHDSVGDIDRKMMARSIKQTSRPKNKIKAIRQALAKAIA